MCSVLTDEIFTNAIRDFFRNKPFLFFGAGMSCALDARFGMHALQDFLLNTINKHNLTQNQKEEWSQVVFLNPVTDDDLLKILITETGHFLSSLDKEYSLKILNGEIEWPATRLFKKKLIHFQKGIALFTH